MKGKFLQNPPENQWTFAFFEQKLVEMESRIKQDSVEDDAKKILNSQEFILQRYRNPAPREYRKEFKSFLYEYIIWPLYVLSLIFFVFFFIAFFWFGHDVYQLQNQPLILTYLNESWIIGRWPNLIVLPIADLLFIFMLYAIREDAPVNIYAGLVIFFIAFPLVFSIIFLNSASFVYPTNQEWSFLLKQYPTLKVPDLQIVCFYFGLIVAPSFWMGAITFTYIQNPDPEGAAYLYAGWLYRITSNGRNLLEKAMNNKKFLGVLNRGFYLFFEQVEQLLQNERGMTIENKKKILYNFCTSANLEDKFINNIVKILNPAFFEEFFRAEKKNVEVLLYVLNCLAGKMIIIPYHWWQNKKLTYIKRFIEVGVISIGATIATFWTVIAPIIP